MDRLYRIEHQGSAGHAVEREGRLHRVSGDPFGTYAAGGVAFLFSDLLGNHVVATSAQVTNRFDEFGGSAFR